MKTPKTPKTPKIAKVQIARKRGLWGGYKVREITSGGRVLNSYDAFDIADARRMANFSARTHGVEVEVSQ